MTKPIVTTLALLALTTSAAAYPSGQDGSRQSGPVQMEATPFGCSSQAEIDLGWEYQQQLIDVRLAARSASGLTVPGAIISSPFPAFAPYRSDVPAAHANSSNRGRQGSTSPESAVRKS